ncbi:hypothetical protein DID76_02375 [Candidatus Marinamargulisbacteria bacterium SCGC AG-414-C22]|nr:hypothetical protein DID76_02375 [Candidatus Marinamargulisbacteria bacterium SCGC AG-414-C22]
MFLKQNGYIAIGIESRFEQAYWLDQENNNNLKYTNLMPKILANTVTKLKKRYPYRTWTYTYKSLKKLMQKAGFNIESTYYPNPSYRFCDSLIALDNWKVFNDYISRYGLKQKSYLNYLKFLKYGEICAIIFFYLEKNKDK